MNGLAFKRNGFKNADFLLTTVIEVNESGHPLKIHREGDKSGGNN